MKIIRTTILLVIAMMYTGTASAQDVKIFLKDGSKLLVPYDQLDSIVSISYTEKDFVDLGLSVRWAAYNVGAEKPEDTGSFFAWGETQPKKSYRKENSIMYDKDMTNICSDVRYDAAACAWGVTMRMPTEAEFTELMNLCVWTPETLEGVGGYRVTGPNGNSIFLPAAGYINIDSYDHPREGYYWSGDPLGKENEYAVGIHFGNEVPFIIHAFRYFGFLVRPVTRHDLKTEIIM